MDALKAIFLIVKDWGAVPLCGVLIYVVLHLVKKIDDNTKKAEERDSKFRTDIHQTLNKFGERLSIVEKDYVKNDIFHQNLSGWRSEINRLSDKIDNQFASIFQSIVQLLNKGN